MNMNDILILLFVTYIMSIAMFIGALKNRKIWNWCLGFPIFYMCYFLVSLLQKRNAISKVLMASLFIVGLIAIALNLVAIIVAIVNRLKNVEDTETDERYIAQDFYVQNDGIAGVNTEANNLRFSDSNAHDNVVNTIECGRESGTLADNPSTCGAENSSNIVSDGGNSFANGHLNSAVNNVAKVNSMPTNTVASSIENGQTMQNNANNYVASATSTNYKFITKGFKWFILGCMIATKDRNNNTKTGKMDRYGNISIQDNSNRGSIIVRPCGKCSSVSGEKPLDFVFGFKPLKKEFVCCGGFSGFSFRDEDIVSYKLISSNAKNERYELQHVNGKKIMLNCNSVGSELLNAVLGSDKFVNAN